MRIPSVVKKYFINYMVYTHAPSSVRECLVSGLIRFSYLMAIGILVILMFGNAHFENAHWFPFVYLCLAFSFITPFALLWDKKSARRKGVDGL